VRKSQYIVACLLEASAKGTTLRFGPGDDPYGEEYSSFEAACEGKNAAEMMQNGYSFVTQKNPGDVGVYSLKPKIATMERGTELVAHTFGLDPESKVHFSNQPQAPGTPIPLKDVFRERKMKGNSGEPEPERKNPVKAAGVAHQPSDVEELEMLQPDPEREAYVQSLQGKPAVQNMPLDFGMEVDSTFRQGGVLVSHIVPGGPASQGNLQSGDRIVKVNFETGAGSWGPYQIKTLDDFKKFRSFMELGYPIGLRVIRGGHEYPASIMPKSGAGASETTGSQVSYRQANPFQQALHRMKRDEHDLPHLTLAELAQYHNITPKQVAAIIDKIPGARTRDYAPHDFDKPNERDPASVTGNMPANPSALT
jgi:hypothetical protein